MAPFGIFRRGPKEDRRKGKGPDTPAASTDAVSEPPKPEEPIRGQQTQDENDAVFLAAREKIRKELDPERIRPGHFIGRNVKVIRRGEVQRTERFSGQKINDDNERVTRHKARVVRKEIERRTAIKNQWWRRKVVQNDVRNAERAETAEAVLSKILPVLLPGAEVIRTSEYDDRINGIDLVVLFRDKKTGDVSLAWGIDLTSASDPEQSIERKMVNSLKGLADATASLSNVRYVTATRPDGEKEYLSLERVPKVVLGLSEESVRFCAQMWLDGPDAMQKMDGSKFQVGVLNAIRDAFQGQVNLIDRLKKEGDVSHMKPAEMEIDESLLRVQTLIANAGFSHSKAVRDRTRERIQGIYLSRKEMRRLYARVFEPKSRRLSETDQEPDESDSPEGTSK